MALLRFHWRWWHWLLLLLPLAITLLLTKLIFQTTEEFRIPVAIVDESTEQFSKDLLVALHDAPYIDVREMDRSAALRTLERHEVDSVFLFNHSFDEQIEKGERQAIVESYTSNLSFGYSTAKEIITAHIQQIVGRERAAIAIEHIVKRPVNHAVIAQQSIQAERERQLLTVVLHDESSDSEQERTTTMPLLLWSILTMIGTYIIGLPLWTLIRSSLRWRFPFSRLSSSSLFWRQWAILNGIALLADGIAYMLLNFPSLWTVAAYRLTLFIGIGLLFTLFHTTRTLHRTASVLLFILIATASTTFTTWHPFAALLRGTFAMSLVVCCLLALTFAIRKENLDVTRTTSS